MASPQTENGHVDVIAKGYLYFYREWFQSPCFLDSELWKVFSWTWFKAQHKDQWVALRIGRGETQVLVKRGQFIFGRLKGAKELRMKPSSLYRRIQKLEKLKILDIKADRHYSIITLCNYDLLQNAKKPSGQASGQATDSQRTHTINDKLMGIKKKGAAPEFLKDSGPRPERNFELGSQSVKLILKNLESENGNETAATK